MQIEKSQNKSSHSPLKVRVGKGYALKFIILHGQRNAEFIQKQFPPLHRLLQWAIAIALAPEPSCDLIHSFNAIPVLTDRPYLITFEDFLPRVPEDHHIHWLESLLQKRLFRPQCVALIAMSEYARRQFLWQNRSFARLPLLEEKLHVIYPAKQLYRKSPKSISNKLRLIFSGNDYMRKGLPILLKAHKQLQKVGVPVQTTIVSSLNWNKQDYIRPPSKKYVKQQQALLSQDGIDVHPFVPYEHLMQLIEKADYLIFPTFHDTFGLVSLDALSCGTPVIATETCAQPEIVENGRCGYLLPFENDSNIGKWMWTYRNHDPGYLEAYDQTTTRLSEALVQRLILCWEERRNYEMLSEGALNQIKTKFNSDSARNKIEKLYELCRDAKK